MPSVLYVLVQFKNELFLRYQVAVVPQLDIKDLYAVEQNVHLKFRENSSSFQGLRDSIIICRHALYGIKIIEDRKMKIVAHIASYGNGSSKSNENYCELLSFSRSGFHTSILPTFLHL